MLNNNWIFSALQNGSVSFRRKGNSESVGSVGTWDVSKDSVGEDEFKRGKLRIFLIIQKSFIREPESCWLFK